MSTIEEIKEAISRRHLRGRGRIHAVGLRFGSQCIVVRVAGRLDPRLADEIRSEAKPYRLEIIESAPAYALHAHRPSKRVHWPGIP